MAEQGIYLKITLENGQLKAALTDSTGAVRKFGAEAKGAGADAATGMNEAGNAATKAGSKLNKLNEHVGSVTRAFRDLRRAVLLVYVGRELLQLIGDVVNANVEMQRIHFTFQAATGSAEAANKEFQFVSEAAKTLGLNVQVAATSLAQMEAAGRGANVPLEQTRDLWLAVAKATVVFHLGATQAQAVMLALTQMMAKGKIQSQELQLQLSQALPIGILSRFADAIGISVSQLQKMMQSGELLTSKYLPALSQAIMSAVDPAALEEASKGLNAELNRLHSTIFGLETGKQSTFVESFTGAIHDLNVTLNDPGVQQGMSTLISDLGHVASLAIRAAAAFAKFTDAVADFFGGKIPKGALAEEEADLKHQQELIKTYKLALSSPNYQNMLGPKYADMTRSEMEEALRVAENRAKLVQMAIDRIRQASYSKIGPYADSYHGLNANGTTVAPAPAGAKITVPGNAAAGAEAEEAALEAQGIVLKDSLDRKKKLLDDALAANKISYADYWADVAKIQTQALDQQIAVQSAKIAAIDATLAAERANKDTSPDQLAKDEAKRAQLMAQLTVLTRKLGDVGVDAAAGQTAANKKLNQQLDAVKQKLLSFTDPITAAKAKIEQQFADLIAQLRAQGRDADLKLVMQLEVQEENKAAADTIQQQAQTIVDRVRGEQQALANKVQIGTLAPAAAQTALATGQQDAAQQLDALIAKAKELHSALGAQLVASLEKSKAAILGLKQPVGQIVTDIANGLLSNTQQFIQTLISGTASASDAVKAFGRSIVQMLDQIAAKIIAMQALQAILGAFGYQMTPTGTIAAIPAHAEGGAIDGRGSDTSDNILSWLSPGEFVLRAKAVRTIVQHFGVDFLKRLNRADQLPRFAAGGYAGYVQASSNAAARAAAGNLEINVPVTITGDAGDESMDKRRGAQLGAALKAAIQKEIANQQRPGGILYHPA